MRYPVLFLVAATACATSSGDSPEPAQVGDPVVADLRRLATAKAPVPPELYVLGGPWWVGRFGNVAAFDQGMVAIRMEKPDEWPADVLHLLLPIADGRVGSGIKGDAVVVGRNGDVLLCRYHPNRHGSLEPPVPGDEAWVDFSTSFAMQQAWRESTNGGDRAEDPDSPTGRSRQR